MSSVLIAQLMDALRVLPGVGPKSAQRMAYHLLEKQRGGASQLVQALQEALDKVGHCQQCRTLSESEICNICSNDKRDASQICIVETPADVLTLEQAAVYRGKYFVLMGHLSPIDGVGPQELGLDILQQRFNQGELDEVILATNPTVEGEVTAHYIQNMALKAGIRVTRLAQGIPLGGELEYIDAATLTQAFQRRSEL